MQLPHLILKVYLIKLPHLILKVYLIKLPHLILKVYLIQLPHYSKQPPVYNKFVVVYASHNEYYKVSPNHDCSICMVTPPPVTLSESQEVHQIVSLLAVNCCSESILAYIHYVVFNGHMYVLKSEDNEIGCDQSWNLSQCKVTIRYMGCIIENS